MPSPSDLRFTETHEWFRVEGDTVTMGITQFAANELTDKQLVKRLFPKEIRAELKRVLADLNAPKRKKQAKKRAS